MTYIDRIGGRSKTLHHISIRNNRAFPVISYYERIDSIMTELKQFGIILLILWVGQTIQRIFGLALPGNVLGMLFLLILLTTGTLKLKHVEKITNVLLGHLSFLFVPSIVGVMTVTYLIKGNVTKIFFIILVSFIVVMITAGGTVQWMQEKKKQTGGEDI